MVAPQLDALDSEGIERGVVLATEIGQTGRISGAPRNIYRADCNVFSPPKRIGECWPFDA
jgi:hypothetical protein